MNVKEFVSIWKKERDDLYSMYVSEKSDTAVSKILNDLNLDVKQKSEINKAIDFILTDTFYLFLMGLAGSASVGGTQQDYKVYDEEGHLIFNSGDLEAEAYEQLHVE
jgi:hypothetical protein